MTQVVNQMLQKTIGSERLRELTPEERKRITAELERVIAQRGTQEAESRLRRFEALRRQPQGPVLPGDPNAGKTDLYAIGTAVLLMKTVSAAFDSPEPEAEEEKFERGGADDSPFADPFTMRDPKPDYV